MIKSYYINWNGDLNEKNYNNIDLDFKEVVEKDYSKIILLVVILFLVIIIIVLIYNNKNGNQNLIDDNNKKEEQIRDNIENKNDINEVIEVKKEYYCLEGYELKEDKCIQVSKISPITKCTCDKGRLSNKNCIIESREYGKLSGDKNENSGIELSCEEGYTMDVENMKCYKIVEILVPATTPYNCLDGYTLSETDCIKEL